MRTPASVLTLALALALAAPAGAQKLLQLPDNREGWPWGLCIHQVAQADGPATEALDGLGAPWVRIDANWNELEPGQDQYDWSILDRMVDTARAHGYLVYATLAYTPQWATDGAVRNGVPRQPAYYGDFVRTAVERYRDRVKHWGLWNEPEGAHFWAGTPQQYVDLVLRPGFEAVRAADPDALVLGPDSGSDDWLDQIFSAGGGAYLDVITVHVYACCDDSDDVDKVLWRLDCTGGWPWDTCRRKVIERHGLGDKPVWLTEVGWKTLTADWEAKQAAYYTGLLAAMLERPWWKKTIFYELYDATPCDPGIDNCWGIVGLDWTPKTAYAAFRDFIAGHQPRAEAGADRQAAPGEPIVLDGTASADPDGAIVRHRWDFDRADGVTAQAEGAAVSHAFPAAGDYVVTLVVDDDDGIQDADTLTVHVSGEPWPDGGTADGADGEPDASETDGGDGWQDAGELDAGPEDAADGASVTDQPAPDGGDGTQTGDNPSADGGGSDGDSGADDGPGPDDPGGCGCAASGGPAVQGSWWLIASLALLRRRRKASRAASSTRPRMPRPGSVAQPSEPATGSPVTVRVWRALATVRPGKRSSSNSNCALTSRT